MRCPCVLLTNRLIFLCFLVVFFMIACPVVGGKGYAAARRKLGCVAVVFALAFDEHGFCWNENSFLTLLIHLKGYLVLCIF